MPRQEMRKPKKSRSGRAKKFRTGLNQGKKTSLRIDIITIFPEMFEGPFQESMIKIARQKGLVGINLVNLRDFTTDKRRTVDDKPFGGGPGMVMKPEPLFSCIAKLKKQSPKGRVILMTPAGKRFNQSIAQDLSKAKHLILICGHYEGVDERVREHLVDEEISLGDFVLTGGEIPAMALVDALTRLVPGVLGNTESLKHESFQDGILDYPHYTRPRVFKGRIVPEVLFSGDHKKVEAWRKQEAMRRTQERRPDLLQ